MKNFIGNLNIAMIIVWAIGFFGGMAEPGPVPKLMVIVAGAYLVFSISVEIVLYVLFINQKRMLAFAVAGLQEAFNKYRDRVRAEDRVWTE